MYILKIVPQQRFEELLFMLLVYSQLQVLTCNLSLDTLAILPTSITSIESLIREFVEQCHDNKFTVCLCSLDGIVDKTRCHSLYT